jgi:signal transduction histidine kinase
MRANSLAFRLFVTTAAWVLLVLPLAGWLIYAGYREETLVAFDNRIAFFLTVVVTDADEQLETAPNMPNNWGEGLFEITHSGWYWQITPLDGQDGRILRSPSLSGDALPLPSANKIGPNEKEIRWGNLTGPAEQQLRIAEQFYMFGEGRAGRYSVAVAGKLSEVEETLAAFRAQLIQALALAGIGLLAVTLFQIRFGLLPLSRMEKGLAGIRSGEVARLEGDLPVEIKPLQQELNALLKSNEEIVDRSRTHVGNLAHALKTPLAVLINEARSDPSPLARKVIEQADIMAGQVSLYLDRARMAARIGVIGRVTDVRPVGESIVRALERIHQDRRLEFKIECPFGTRFQGERHDLEEMLGNLLDNASKWAHGRVDLVAAPLGHNLNGKTGDWLEIRVDDDGPGLTPDQLAQPVVRGRRLDETKPGSGLGLSIVADLAYCYNGKFELAPSELGGLSARLTLPRAV